MMGNAAKFLVILFWEMLENFPMLVGFMLAIRFWTGNLDLALACLLSGAALGAGMIHFTEGKKLSNHPTLKETLINFLVFAVLGIPLVFYFVADDAWWSNWMTDVLFGIVVGGMLTVGESWGWRNTSAMKVHAVSMAIAAALFLLGIRFTYRVESLIAMFAVGVVLNLFVSIMIVSLEYWLAPMPPEKKSETEQEDENTGDYLRTGEPEC